MSGILFITRNFPPLVGGMERLALESVRALSAEWPVDLIGPLGCERAVDRKVRATGVVYRSVPTFLLAGWWQVQRLTRGASHSIVIGGSGLAAPLVQSATRQSIAASVCFVHGLDLVVDNAVYRRCCLPAVRKMDLVIANSRNTARLASEVGIPPDRVQMLNPGVKIDEECSESLFHSAFPQVGRRPLLLSVGRLSARKGLVDFVDSVLPRLVEAHPDVLLVVAGGVAADALLCGGDEAERLARSIEQAGMHGHILLTGYLENDVLASLYAAARVMVFPVKDMPGDVEGFGMVALEAAAHGLPTVAFAAGGVADAVADGVSGTLVAPGDYQRMAAVISDYLTGEPGVPNGVGCRAFAADFAWPVYARRLRELVRGQLPPRSVHRQ